MSYTRWLWLWILLFSLAACSGESGAGDADAGTSPDSGGNTPDGTPGDASDADAPDGNAMDARTDGSPLPDGSPTLPCVGKPGTPGDHVVTFEHDGRSRTAQVHVPDSYDAATRTMLVFNFHGFTSNGAQQRDYSRMAAKSDERGFIAVHPDGFESSWNAGTCCGAARDQGVDDVGYVMALLDALEETYCIDERRIFSTGMSNGGFLSYRLACERSDRFAAIASVTGVLGLEPTACDPGRPIPVLHIHGTSDNLVLYEGGTTFVGTFASVTDSVARFRAIDGCPDSSTETFASGDVRCERWGPCAEGSEVVLCTVTDGGHTWPGADPIPFLGNTTTNLDATEHLLDFFEAHPMPE